MDTKTSPQLEADRLRIARLGGPAALSRLLGYEAAGGVQRVHNWLTRGIPPAVKLERPDLFLVEISSLAPRAEQPEAV